MGWTTVEFGTFMSSTQLGLWVKEWSGSCKDRAVGGSHGLSKEMAS